MSKPQRTREIEVEIEDEPGALADIADRLGREEINILGFMTDAKTGRGHASFVTSDTERALETLKEAGYSPEATESLIVPAENRPGELGNLARRLEKENISIERSFVATGKEGEHLGIGLRVNDPSRARKILDV